MTTLVTQDEARKAGRARGVNAASWMFDGNTTDETYRAFLKGFDEGDPAIMDQYQPSSWLSGENAGESINEILGEALSKRDLDRLERVQEVYEAAADQAYWDELVKTARRMVRESNASEDSLFGR